MPKRTLALHAVAAASLVFGMGAGASSAQTTNPSSASPSPLVAFGGSASGTARLPLATTMGGPGGRFGEWGVNVHGFGTVNARWDPEPRGEQDLFITNMMMVSGRRPVGPGWLELRAMASAEPTLGSAGYSLLLQTGETADGINALVDRQHPHDLLMELSASYRFEIETGAWAFVYVAPVGEPALGPVPFMHRPSGRANPVAPLTHHVLDATHISHGVVTAGLFVDERVQIEASLFNAHEPDQDRWAPEAPGLNSFSGRLTVFPGRSWAVQASFADLKEPEQLHPAIDVYRVALSVTHHQETAVGMWSSTLAWGRNTRQRTTMTLAEARARLPGPLLDHYLGLSELPPDADDSLRLLFEQRTQSGLLVESTLRTRSSSVFARYESVQKDELYPAPDPRHSDFFDVRKISLGIVRDLATAGDFALGIGGTASLHFVPAGLATAYGDGLAAYMLFARVGL